VAVVVVDDAVSQCRPHHANHNHDADDRDITLLVPRQQ